MFTRPIFIGAAVVTAALVTGIATVAEFDAQRQSAPPHVERPKAGVQTVALPAALSGADPEATQGLVLADYISKEQERERQEAAARAEAERLAAEEAARVEAARRAPVTPAPRGGASSTNWPSSLQPCGGDLPPCWVKQRESGGNYSAVNWSGCGGRSCGGAWQFDPRTWAGFGGYTYAQDAPPEVQDAKARLLWAGGAGCSHWAAC